MTKTADRESRDRSHTPFIRQFSRKPAVSTDTQRHAADKTRSPLGLMNTHRFRVYAGSY